MPVVKADKYELQGDQRAWLLRCANYDIPQRANNHVPASGSPRRRGGFKRGTDPTLTPPVIPGRGKGSRGRRRTRGRTATTWRADLGPSRWRGRFAAWEATWPYRSRLWVYVSYRRYE